MKWLAMGIACYLTAKRLTDIERAIRVLAWVCSKDDRAALARVLKRNGGNRE